MNSGGLAGNALDMTDASAGDRNLLIRDDNSPMGIDRAFSYQAPLVDPNEKKINFGRQNSQSESKLAGISQKKSASQLGRSLAQKSVSGFDVGVNKAVGAFYSSMRQEANGEKTNFYDTGHMKGRDFVQKLIKQQEDRYHKKFAFERGYYHQCIPNPKKEHQMITVQIVTRQLEGLSKKKGLDQMPDADDAFGDVQNQDSYKEINTVSQQFMRYNLVPPDFDANDLDNGEGEGEDEDRTTRDKFNPNMSQDSQGISLYGQVDPSLYKDSNLNLEVDQLTGVCPTHYANIDQSKS